MSRKSEAKQRVHRVTFVTTNYAPSVGGTQLLVKHLAEGLVERHRLDVEVITTNAIGPPTARDPGWISGTSATINGVQVHRFPVARRTHRALIIARRIRSRVRAQPVGGSRKAGPLSAGPLGLRFQLAVWRACWRRDVVVGVAFPYVSSTTVGSIPRQVARATRIALPLLHHTTQPAYTPTALWAIGRFDAAVALTSFEADELRRLTNNRGRIRVIAPGCDVSTAPTMAAQDARAHLGLPRRTTVGFVGRFAPHKGVGTILSAAPLILARHPNVTILLAGARTGWEGFAPLLAAAAAELGSQLVVREGFDEADRHELFSACDVIMTPSSEESFGMVNIEAWAAGRPVVAGDIPAVRSVVRHGVDGILIEPEDPVALANNVSMLLSDPELTLSMGRSGRRRAEIEFSWEAAIARWATVLLEPRAAPANVQ